MSLQLEQKIEQLELQLVAALHLSQLSLKLIAELKPEVLEAYIRSHRIMLQEQRAIGRDGNLIEFCLHQLENATKATTAPDLGVRRDF